MARRNGCEPARHPIARRRRTTRAVVWLIAMAWLCVGARAHADHYDPRELEPRVSAPAAQACLQVATRLEARHDKTAADLLAIYEAEVCIGKFGVWVANASSDELDSAGAEGVLADEESVLTETRRYLHARRARFRIVSDGWKDETALWEPDGHWLEELRRASPDSEERWEIEWDREWKKLTRQFSFGRDAVGKSCRQVYEEHLAAFPKEDPPLYGPADVMERIADCELRRRQFRDERERLEARFASRPGRKKRAFDPHPEEVVSNLYFGLC